MTKVSCILALLLFLFSISVLAQSQANSGAGGNTGTQNQRQPTHPGAQNKPSPHPSQSGQAVQGRQPPNTNPRQPPQKQPVGASQQPRQQQEDKSAQNEQDQQHQGPPTYEQKVEEDVGYWEQLFTKYFQTKANDFYQHFEKFFNNFLLPGYYLVKKSMLLTTALFFLLTLVLMTRISKMFRGSGSGKKFRYNKEEPLSYSDLNQHFRNFTKELLELKKQVGKAPEGIPAESKGASTTALPEFEKMSKSLSKTEDHLTKLFQENKQLNQFLGSFQREILESHKDIWHELHTLKTTSRSGASTTRPSERRGQSVSASDERLSRKTQDMQSLPQPAVKPQPQTFTAKPELVENAAAPLDNAGDDRQPRSKEPQQPQQPQQAFEQTGQQLTSNPTAQDDELMNSTQTLGSTGAAANTTDLTNSEIGAGEPTNPFAAAADDKKPEQTKPPGMGSNPAMRHPAMKRANPVGGPRPTPTMGGMKQPPLTISDPQNPTNEVIEPVQRTPSNMSSKGGEDNASISTQKGADEIKAEPTNITTGEDQKPSGLEEVQSPQTQAKPFGGPAPFKGLPGKKPTPVVRNNFPIPQKRAAPKPNPFVNKPVMNPGALGANGKDS